MIYFNGRSFPLTTLLGADRHAAPHPGLADVLVSLRWSISTNCKVQIEDKVTTWG